MSLSNVRIKSCTISKNSNQDMVITITIPANQLTGISNVQADEINANDDRVESLPCMSYICIYVFNPVLMQIWDTFFFKEIQIQIWENQYTS